MSALVLYLRRYGAYHRDERNIATHQVGIPLIVLAVAILASRPMIVLPGNATGTPAMVLSAAATFFYLRLDLRFGLVMATLLAIACWLGIFVARLPTGSWLTIGMFAFSLGWALQFLGHHYEGRKPAFLDDVRGLIVGPIFVLAETAFALGLRQDVRDAVSGGSDRCAG